MSDTDGDWERDLGAVLERVSRLSAGYNRAYETPILSGSVRAQDDVATHGLTIGIHAEYCLVQAVDMCEGIRTLLADEDGLRIPLAASYPLARAAIESASLAVWMMKPADRRDRVVRRLQAASSELKYERAFIKSATGQGATSHQAAARRANARGTKVVRATMREIAKAHRIEAEEYEQAMPGWESIVSDASDILYGKQRGSLVGAWRFTSGLTHPSALRGLIAHVFDPEDEGGNRGEVSGSIEWITSTAFVAEALTRKAIVRLVEAKLQLEASTAPSDAG
ncbi:hypothetical protein [Microbacterium arborescens]|uniref:hypothetical protein n=1 Tax=Microbacterium arborescens TaxID=33883 RepID=UPI003C7939BE